MPNVGTFIIEFKLLFIFVCLSSYVDFKYLKKEKLGVLIRE